MHDLSRELINSIGPALCLWPEVFEEHLVKSGYTAASYEDAESSTWPTRFLRKQQVSLRWHSLVRRRDMEPRDIHSRRLLLNGELEWKRAFREGGPGSREGRWQTHSLHAIPNIFRQEWSLSSVNRAMRSGLVEGERRGLIDISKGDEQEHAGELQHTPENEMDIVAWEERVTFCWGSWGLGRVPILLFDPLPRMRQKETVAVEVVPFSGRFAPRGPPPAQEFNHDPTALDAVSEYVTKTDDALTDAVAWINYITERPVGHGNMAAVDLVLFAVLQVVRQDTEVLLEHIGSVLEQISKGSMDERMMQEQLWHWRTVMSRLQSELPALERSMGEFFAFLYSDFEAADAKSPPPQILNTLSKLQADTTTMTERCQEVPQSLRAEMSLLESKRGIEEAESVSRLTELAFLFVPITLAAGFFSMQIKELVDEPAPAYVFSIAAVIAVTISYSLRLVQRSTVVSELLHKWEKEIRRKQEVTTRTIPIRKVAIWLVWKLRIKLLIAFIGGGGSTLFLATLWTRRAMDVSLKGAMTLFVLLGILGLGGCVIWFVKWFSWGRNNIPRSRGNDAIFGFGRIWRAAPRSRDWRTGHLPSSGGNTQTGRREESGGEGQV
ncbi:hypothetical protein GE09DRAFT_1288095 [Coniochaeta sp. 2T2.1]|nr:hypothetical protein GE09DRAFT_1288095 [Coniochaeta sp. 2T2.1]